MAKHCLPCLAVLLTLSYGTDTLRHYDAEGKLVQSALPKDSF